MRYRWFLRREKISHEMSAAPRNDAAPVLRILLEGIVLERIDLTANKISDPSSMFSRGVRSPPATQHNRAGEWSLECLRNKHRQARYIYITLCPDAKKGRTESSACRCRLVGS
jgi:hypothetical protein